MNEDEFQQRLKEMIAMGDDDDNDEDRDAYLLAWDDFLYQCSDSQIREANSLRFSQPEP